MWNSDVSNVHSWNGSDKKLNGSGAVACDINNDGFQDLYIGARGFNGDGLDFRSHIDNNNTEFTGIEDRLFLNMKNGQNTDLNKPKFIVLGTPKKPDKGPRMNLPTARTNFYVQEYQDITWNTNLGKIKT